MNVLIFGINGFVGKYLAASFLLSNDNVYGCDVAETLAVPDYNIDFGDGRFVEPSAFSRVKYNKSDITNIESVKEIVGIIKPDYIINLAAISSVGQSWKKPELTMRINVNGAVNILEAAREIAPLAKLMFIGSSEEYNAKGQEEGINERAPLNANNPYGISKVTQENFIRLYKEKYGMEIYTVRPFNHTGVGQNDNFVLPSFCKQAAEITKSGKDGEIRVGNLSAKRDFSDVRDVVCAYRLILESGNCNEVYNVGSSVARGLDEMLEKIVSFCPNEVTITIDKERFRPEDTPVIKCDNSKIKRELGYKPKHDIYDTLKEMYEYYVKK